jgi:hypothetical protein
MAAVSRRYPNMKGMMGLLLLMPVFPELFFAFMSRDLMTLFLLTAWHE